MSIRLTGVLQVLRKEVGEMRRDRTLAINLVLIPLFMYPLMGLLIYQVWLVMEGASEKQISVAYVDEAAPSTVPFILSEMHTLRLEDIPAPLGGDSPPETYPAVFRAWRDSLDKAGAEPPVALLDWRTRSPAAPDTAFVIWDSSSERSGKVKDAMARAIELVREARIYGAALAAGLDSGDVRPWNVEGENIASAEERGRQMLSYILPVTLMIFLNMGLMYTAVDSIVGERERGTFETLLVAPLHRAEVLLGKYASVVAGSVVAVIMNLASFTILATFVLRLLPEAAQEEFRIGISPLTAALIVFTGLLTAAFLAALYMLVAAPSKNYRQGQAAVMPLYFLGFMPAMMVITSPDPFTTSRAMIPIMNSAGLIKAALLGQLAPAPAAVTMATLLACTVAALVFAGRLGMREELYMDPDITLRRLLAAARARKKA